MSRSRFGLRGVAVAAALGWLATMVGAPAAQAGSDQIQGAAVAACSTSTTALAQNGFNYPNVDAHGNLCTVPASGGAGATAVTGAAGAFVDGWSVTDGSTTDAACSTDNGTCSEVALLKRGIQRLTSLIATMGSPFQAGGNIGNLFELDTTGATANTDLGPPGATACATDNGSCALNALIQRTNQRLTSLITALGSPAQAGGTVTLGAGSAIAGKFGIDQTTPGTTNGVVDAATSATGSAVPAKASYAGTNSSGNLTGLIQADHSVAISVSSASAAQLVALSSGKAIYVTHWDLVVAGADNVTLEYGTGTNCGTGTTVLTGAYNLPANGGLSAGVGLAPVLFVPASNALCIVPSAAVQASGSLAYTQF